MDEKKKSEKKKLTQEDISQIVRKVGEGEGGTIGEEVCEPAHKCDTDFECDKPFHCLDKHDLV